MSPINSSSSNSPKLLQLTPVAKPTTVTYEQVLFSYHGLLVLAQMGLAWLWTRGDVSGSSSDKTIISASTESPALVVQRNRTEELARRILPALDRPPIPNHGYLQ